MQKLCRVIAMIWLAAALTGYSPLVLADAPVVEWSAVSDGHLGQASNRRQCAFPAPRAIAVDPVGNTFLAGCSRNGFDEDILVVKQDPAGVVLWSRRYNGPGHRNDRSNALTIDNLGNVYVAGTVSGLGANLDFVTLKFDTNGAQLWAKIYEGVGDKNDAPNAIVLDANANVIVAGYSTLLNGATVFATIKYDPDGQQEWAAIGNSYSSSYGVAYAIGVDDVGSVYVTGEQDFDFSTVKLDSNGDLQWARKYDGPSPGFDFALDIVVASDGVSYITGLTNQSEESDALDYTTIKYGANGEQLWTALQQDIGSLDEGAHRVSLATDSDGNVFLAGKSRSVSGDFDILAVKYAANGERLWERTHGGSGADDAKDVAVDDDGNVFIVGVMSSVPGSTEFTTLKYNPAGALQWSAAYRRDESGENQPYAVGVDPGGNVIVSGRSIVSGSTTYALSTIKYSADGVQLWLANDPEEAFPDQLNAMTTDASGNIYLAGHRFNGSNFDFHMVKYDANGAFLWAKSHNAVANRNDSIRAIAVDAAQNVYVCGESFNALGKSDYLTLKFSQTGVEQWAAVFEGDAQGNDLVHDIALDATGNVFVTGQSALNNSRTEYLTVKYGSDGLEQWIASFGGGNGSDVARALKVDEDGSVYVTGESHGLSGDPDFATLKYDADGSQQWARFYDGPNHLADRAAQLELDDNGNVYVAGSSVAESITSNANFATLKYTPSGALEWVAFHDNGADNSNDDNLTALALDASG